MIKITITEDDGHFIKVTDRNTTILEKWTTNIDYELERIKRKYDVVETRYIRKGRVRWTVGMEKQSQ